MLAGAAHSAPQPGSPRQAQRMGRDRSFDHSFISPHAGTIHAGVSAAPRARPCGQPTRLVSRCLGPTSFQSQSVNSPRTVPRKLRPMSRSLVFWNAANCHLPSIFCATRVWMESRSGVGADFPRITVPPIACISATSGLSNLTFVTWPTSRVPLR